MGLTKKQEMFCIEVLKQDSYSDAYRIAYDASRMSNESINVKASELMSSGKISVRVKELRSKVEKKELYTLEQSIKRDIKLIERYESALDVLENDKSDSKQIEAAERTIRYIGSSGYSSAQERLSKQSGWFEKDNKQKTQIIEKISKEEIEQHKNNLESEY
jgi:hypothetical protein